MCAFFVVMVLFFLGIDRITSHTGVAAANTQHRALQVHVLGPTTALEVGTETRVSSIDYSRESPHNPPT